MHLSTATYYFATCSGKVDNLLNPRCPAIGPGSFDDKEAIEKATAEGWVEAATGKAYCKTHAAAAVTAQGDDPAPRRRGKAKDTAPETAGQAPAEWSS